MDATIAIAFGLAATITSLIAMYIMWQDRSARRAALQSSEYLN
jgi:FlaG/FlaF family flagellin (archaellin)